MRRRTAKPARQPKGQSQTLLDLNRSLPGFAYQPPERERMKRPNLPAAAVETSKPKRPRWKRILLWALSIILCALLATGGWLAWKFLANEIRVFGWQGLWGLFHAEKLNGEDSGHVNILLAGNSSDDVGHGGATLTDSIMVLSINTSNNTAFMLSIPRDLYVEIPGSGYAKINEAYQRGEADQFQEAGYAEGGMGLLEKTVSEHFGITLHYYALVDYAAVREGVDAVDGIDVTIASDDSRGLYDPSPDYGNNSKPLVDLTNGTHHLNGVQALGLARARGHSYGSYGFALSDFQRSANQRAIILGLKDRATSPGTLANPVKLADLFDTVGRNVKTDLTLGNVRRAGDLLKKIPNQSITSASLNDANDENLLQSYRTPLGASGLIPRQGIDDYSEIRSFVDALLNPPAPTQAKATDAS